MKVYVVDTCAMRELIYHCRRGIPAYDRMWDMIDQLIIASEIVFVKESFSELERQCTTKENVQWLKEKKDFFTSPSNEECEIVAQIYRNRNFQNNVARKNIHNGQPVADAFLVARAKFIGNDAIVVSREVLKPNAAKIPNLCEALGVAYIDDQEFQKILLP